jgi:hypothetical protein
LAIANGGQAGKLQELAIEVGLVRIALSRREIGPPNAWFHSQPIQDTPETQQSAVSFRLQANGLTKDRREVAMAVATFPHHIPHPAGRTKTRQGVGNEGIDPAHTRQSRRESSLEHIKAMGRRPCLAKFLANLATTPAPHTSSSGVWTCENAPAGAPIISSAAPGRSSAPALGPDTETSRR